MFARTTVVVALILLGSSIPAATAATVTITPEVAAILNHDFTPVDSALVLSGNRLLPREESYLLQVDVHLKLSELGDLVGLQRTGFDVQVNDDGAIYFSPELGIAAWTPANPAIDTNGPAPGGMFAKWEINADDGEPSDLQGIILVGATRDAGPEMFDIRGTIGQHPANEIAGTFFIELPGAPR